MTGIVFFASTDRESTVSFYRDEFDATIWLEQPDCTILQLDNQLVGFCDRAEADTDGVITFVKPDRAAVDAVFDRLDDGSIDPPTVNDRYDIYHFYTTDPEGRSVEVQAFLHETPPVFGRG